MIKHQNNSINGVSFVRILVGGLFRDSFLCSVIGDMEVKP